MRRTVGICKTAGFTLVEILTVMVIIGLMSSAVVMTLPRDKPAAVTAATALNNELNMAAQNSLLSGQMAALALSKNGYGIQMASGDEWTTIARRSWPDNVRVDFTRGGQSVDLPEDALPLVLFEPTGLGTVFTLTLSDTAVDVVLRGPGDGTVTMASRS